MVLSSHRRPTKSGKLKFTWCFLHTREVKFVEDVYDAYDLTLASTVSTR